MLNDELLPLVWDQTMLAIKHCNLQTELPDTTLVQDCINTSNKTLAKRLIKIFDLCVE